MEPTGKRWPAIFMREEGREARGAWSYYHVKCDIVVVYENGCVRNCSWDPFGDDQHGSLADLRISCQGEGDSREKGVYAWDAEFHPTGGIDLARAKAMHKVLEAIQRKTQQMDKEWGRPQTYGQYVLRIAKAIGAKEMIRQGPHCRGRSYEDMDLHRKELAEGADTIDYWIRRWQDEAKEEPCLTR